MPHHFPFLEGLRGLVALYVVCHHAWFEVVYKEINRLPSGVYLATRWLRFGQHAVDAFIVLSGFCLMLPLVRDGRLAGGTRGFFARRARRILPPYYAALGLSLLMILAVPIMRAGTGDRWEFALLELSPGTIVSHLLLLHNLSGTWLYGIDPPMWSVATEWQIYFFFALVAVPIFRRWGGTAAALFTVAAGIYFSTAVTAFNYACPWFLSLFGFGMIAAHVVAADSMAALRQRVPWRGLARAALAAYLVFAVAWPSWLSTITLSVDLVVGGVVALLLIDTSRRRGETTLGRLATTRPALWLGRCSYSLYLTHVPCLAFVHLSLRRGGVDTFGRLIEMLLIAVPMATVIAHVFSLGVERPFLVRRPERVGPKKLASETLILRAA